MNTNTSRDESQLDRELLSGMVLGDLSVEEEQRANELLDSEQWRNEFEQLELAAAALSLGSNWRDGNALPASLQDRVRSSASAYVVRYSTKSIAVNHNINKSLGSSSTKAICASDAQDVTLTPAPSTKTTRPSGNYRELVAWLATVAATLIAVASWTYRWPSQEASLSALREQFLAENSDVITLKWSKGSTPFSQEVAGDVVWSAKQQTGYMRFVGMPINLPEEEQYQLWIIDPARDDEPVDGGVFDIRPSESSDLASKTVDAMSGIVGGPRREVARGEVIVKIDAKLRVLDPQAFAITIEQPGGVVVSDQSRLPLLASISK